MAKRSTINAQMREALLRIEKKIDFLLGDDISLFVEKQVDETPAPSRNELKSSKNKPKKSTASKPASSKESEEVSEKK